MHLYPYVRAQRMVASALLDPVHPWRAVALSECASVVLPLLSPRTVLRAASVALTLAYAPQLASRIVELADGGAPTHRHHAAELVAIAAFAAFAALSG